MTVAEYLKDNILTQINDEYKCIVPRGKSVTSTIGPDEDMSTDIVEINNNHHNTSFVDNSTMRKSRNICFGE